MRRVVLGAVLSGLVLTLAVSGPAGASSGKASPPSSAEQIVATNAMLRTGDLGGSLATAATSKDAFRIGYLIPPGGQDPLPVCVYAPRYKTVSVPGDSAVGYSAQYGAVTQDVYRYPSAAAAQRAWATLDRAIPAKCKGSFLDGGDRSTLSSKPLPAFAGGAPGWSVLDLTTSSVLYSTVYLVGDAIQQVTYTAQRPSLPRATAQAIDTLAGTLAARWADRQGLPLTQSATLTKAQTVMLGVADVPAELPVLSPQRGGWSDFTSYQPAGDLFGCFGVLEKLGANATFQVSYGGTGDIFPEVGSIGQELYTYASPESAKADWTRLAKAMTKCSRNATAALPTRGDFERDQHGTSALTYGGVPGLWSRSLEWFDGSGQQCSNASGPVACASFSVKSYTLYLLVGDAIQSVGYVTGVEALKAPKLDQLAVNVLAEQLADRWVQGVPVAR